MALPAITALALAMTGVSVEILSYFKFIYSFMLLATEELNTVRV